MASSSMISALRMGFIFIIQRQGRSVLPSPRPGLMSKGSEDTERLVPA